MMKEEKLAQERRYAEAERRRKQKLDEDLAEDEDFEAFEARQKNKDENSHGDREPHEDDE